MIALVFKMAPRVCQRDLLSSFICSDTEYRPKLKTETRELILYDIKNAYNTLSSSFLTIKKKRNGERRGRDEENSHVPNP